MVRQEVNTAVEKFMPACDEWSEVSIYKTLVDVIAQVSGRVFVGPELCEDPFYIDCATNYTVDTIESVQAIKDIRPWLRPFLVRRLPSLRRLQQKEKDLVEYLRPVIEQRQEAAKDPNWERPDDMTQWMLDRSAGNKLPVVEYARTQLSLIFAAIHTTSTTALNIFYTLAVTPEYTEPLREEIRSVLAEFDGEITTKALQQMEKLDSYMKEVIRFYPIALSKPSPYPTTTYSLLTFTTSILPAQSKQRHHPLQRPTYPRRRYPRSARARRLQRRCAVARQREVRRPPPL
jgi:cytochrome P450